MQSVAPTSSTNTTVAQNNSILVNIFKVHCANSYNNKLLRSQEFKVKSNVKQYYTTSKYLHKKKLLPVLLWI